MRNYTSCYLKPMEINTQNLLFILFLLTTKAHVELKSMAIYGSFVHFVELTMRKQKDRPKWREPLSQRPTKILSPHGKA